MHSFDLMKLQMKQLVVAELDTFCFNGAVTNNTSMYILCNTIQVLHRAMNLVERMMVKMLLHIVKYCSGGTLPR